MDEVAARARIQELCSVSRETIERLEAFAAELTKWNQKINLVSPSTIPELWSRHILDSAQLYPLLNPELSKVCDIGTGGGFPGLILAIIARELHPGTEVAMIESDKRKCAFLQTLSAQLNLNTKVLPKRIEQADAQNADYLTSRALASLTQLLSFAHRHLTTTGHALFLKGAKVGVEIEEALASWEFDLQKRSSETSAEAVVLEISNLRPR